MLTTKCNLADTVYFSLKNRILRGELAPGTPLKEELLSDTLMVSRTPLRKALTQLMAEGYLVRGTDRTLRIPHISLKELKDTLETRRILEIETVIKATALATLDDIDRLEHFIWDEAEALRIHDNILVASLDRMFHNYLAKISDNSVCTEFIKQLEYKVSLYLALSNTLGDVIVEALKEHTEILNAIKYNKPDEAADRMREHLLNAEKRIIARINNDQTETSHAVLIKRRRSNRCKTIPG